MRPAITVVATTYFPPGPKGYHRAEVAYLTMASWRDRLQYRQGDIRYHIADDGSADHGPVRTWFPGITYSRQERHGVGASLNAGFRQAFEASPLVAYFVDDWELTAPFDLTPWADLLMEREDVGMVRLGPPHPNTRGTVEMFSLTTDPPANPERGGWFQRLEPYAFAFGHRPALYHRRFLEAFGWFAEDVNALECERIYAERYAREGLFGDVPQVVLALPQPWRHVDSVELADLQPGSDR